MSPFLSDPRRISRRQSLTIAAWALLGASCDASTPQAPVGAAATGAATAAAAPPSPLPILEGVSDPDVRRFYELRGGKPAWTPAQAQVLTRSFDDARQHGLDPAAFAVKPAAGSDPDHQDVALTLAALRYARALAFGFVDPKSIEPIYTLQSNRIDIAAGLQQALSGGNLGAWLGSLPPSDAEYKAISAAYLAVAGSVGARRKSDAMARCQAAPEQGAAGASPPDQNAAANPPSGGEAAPSPSGEAAPSGGSSEDRRSSAESPPAETPAAPEPAPKATTPAHPAAAVMTRSDRARQLAANLERRRWLDRSPPTTRIDVNTASCALAYVRPQTDPWAARVVCGKVGHETPSIQGSFHRLIANPPWRVPMKIARKEIFPKGSGYMRREQMRVVDGQVVQRPGPRNSLGLVKFDVEDPYEIYLHDTPSKSLFALPDRHKSHGCVRVQNALGLARLIAGQNGKAEAFDKALASGDTGTVDIGEAIPVRLLYHTAFVDGSGQVMLVPDVYGWNDKLATALGLGPAEAAALREEPDVDFGP